jgi:hypothetical protein
MQHANISSYVAFIKKATLFGSMTIFYGTDNISRSIPGCSPRSICYGVGLCWQLSYNILIISSCITHGLRGRMFHPCNQEVTSHHNIITSSHLAMMSSKPFEAMETRRSRWQLSHYYQHIVLKLYTLVI